MTNIKELLPFNVSARTARLIGRENVATSEGAIIELVKNTYDADSDFCIIKFEIPYVRAPEVITKLELNEFSVLFARKIEEIKKYYYINNVGDYVLHSEKYRKEEKKVDSIFLSVANIYIIDAGEGMNVETIKNHWMTIGTDNKFDNYITESKKRTKSGAKGIGRFALDRLGEVCQMWTKKHSSHKVLWTVDWETFEQTNKTISEINATIEIIENNEIILSDFLSVNEFNLCKKELESRKKKVFISDELNNGTVIKISYLRDSWDSRTLKRLKEGLEKLVPPVEDDSFQIFFFNNLSDELNGLLRPEYCDNYDYKLDASIKSNLVNISITRNEFDVSKIPSEFYTNNQSYKEFEDGNKIFRETLSLGNLMPGSSENGSLTLADVGDFTFTLYFMKKNHNSVDGEKYFYNSVNYKERNQWLEHNSGIKIFRDHFRVRPYGEEKNSSWDWLGLGNRVALDPSQVSRKGKWKVSPQNISGVINISRVNNPLLADKSNREGLHENQAFSYFKLLIIALIKKFEDDRSTLFSEFDAFYKAKKHVPDIVDISG